MIVFGNLEDVHKISAFIVSGNLKRVVLGVEVSFMMDIDAARSYALMEGS